MIKKLRQVLQTHYLLMAFLLFYFSILAYKLIKFPTPFFDWDESLYVENGVEMLKSHYFLAPLWQGKVWLDKPFFTPLLFGLIHSLPLTPEISIRIFVLTISVLILIFVYWFYYRQTKNIFIPLLTVIGTALSPIFLQRAQVASLDIFLLLGWYGYFLFLNNFWASTFFAFLSVQSKSLLGFYPLLMYLLLLFLQLLFKQIKKQEFQQKLKILGWQLLIVSLWYGVMFLVFKEKFYQAHIIETHFKRVSASIESHFGQRTYYLTLLTEQLGLLTYLAVGGLLIICYKSIKLLKSLKFPLSSLSKPNYYLLTTTYYLLLFFPWFIFLNLTKTKIAWYLYPALPQFFFLAFYPLILLNKNRLISLLITCLTGFFLIRQALIPNRLLATFYSQNDPHIQISRLAKAECQNVQVLVPSYTRQTYSTLKKLNLIIGTTNWWGEHPSMVYYFGKPLDFFYSISEFIKTQAQYQCSISSEKEIKLVSGKAKLIKKIGQYYLFKN